MKHTVKFIIILISTIGIATSFKNESPIDLGKTVFEIYKSNEIEKLIPIFISQSEFKTLLSYSIQKVTPEKEEVFLARLIQYQEQIIQSAKDDRQIIHGNFDWENSKIDSVNFDYIFPKSGDDSLILWPESKNILISKIVNKVVVSKIRLYANDGKNKIKMTVDGAPYVNGKWTLMESKIAIE